MPSIKRMLFPVSAVLPGYVQPKNRSWIRLRNVIAIGSLIFFSAFYGLLAAVFPVSFYMYLMFPLVPVIFMIVWALPDSHKYPSAAIVGLIWAYMYSIALWPNYLAIALPGLPWITINRIILSLLAAIFLYSVATSRSLRGKLGDVMRHNRGVMTCFFVYVFAQAATLFFSESFATSLNKLIDAELGWNLAFLASLYVFSSTERWTRFINAMLVCSFVLCILSVPERLLEHLPWLNYIPPFVATDDESVQRILQGVIRNGVYRVQSIFSTSLNFAEFLALCVPFTIERALHGRTVTIRALSLLYIPVLFVVILSTGSRLGVVGFFASFLLYGTLYSLRRWLRSKNDILGPAFVLLYPLMAALFFALSVISNRLGSIMYGTGATQASDDGRELQWVLGWPKILEWPLGYGIGNAGNEVNVRNGLGVLTIDSYYLVVLLDYGVIGGVAYILMFVIGSMATGRMSLRLPDDVAPTYMSLATVLSVFVLLKYVLAQEDSHGLVFMMLGASCALRNLALGKPTSTTASPDFDEPRRLAGGASSRELSIAGH